MLSVLAISLAGMRTQVYEQVFMAQGRSKLASAANLLRMIGLLVMVPSLHHFGGLSWAVWGVALAPFATLPLIFIMRKRDKMPGWRADAWILPGLVAGAGAGALATHLLHVLGH